MKEEHITDLISAYALGILDDNDFALVEEHMSGCDACQREFRAYQQVVDELPLAIALRQPPPELKASLMQRIRAGGTGFQESRLDSWWARLVESLRKAAPAWGLASLVLLLVLAMSNLFLWQRLEQIENNQAESMATVALVGTEFTPGATGLLVISRDGEHGTLVVDGLPALSDVQQYQLWLILDGQRDNGGVFSVDREGYGSLWVSSENPLSSYQAVGITIEPAGGSPGPTGEKVLGGEL